MIVFDGFKIIGCILLAVIALFLYIYGRILCAKYEHKNKNN